MRDCPRLLGGFSVYGHNLGVNASMPDSNRVSIRDTAAAIASRGKVPGPVSTGPSWRGSLAREVHCRALMKTHGSHNRAQLAWIVGACVWLVGVAACASGGASLGQGLAWVVAALAAAGIGGFMSSGCRQERAPLSADSGFNCNEGSLPPGTVGTDGWARCCVAKQVRVCPPPPPTVACNYGLGETFCPDGLTCGPTWADPCGTGRMDASTDTASTDGTSTDDASTDAAADAGTDGLADASTDAAADTAPPRDSATDANPDAFLGCGAGSRPADGGMPEGWTRCCIAKETRWCPPQPPNVACNYGMARFCSDGITCDSSPQASCDAAVQGSAEAFR